MCSLRTLSQVLKIANSTVIRESHKQIKPIFEVYCLQKNSYSNEVAKFDFSKKKLSILDPQESYDLTDYGSVLLPTYNLGAYADKSVLLQEFIKLGVELYKLEKRPHAAEFILQLDFEKNVKPYLVFLHHNGLPGEEFGKFITKNPFIFKEDLADLQVRVNYLKSKKFTDEMISTIITKSPKWLSIPVKTIDGNLGFLQHSFKLKGDEVRKLVTHMPILATIPKKVLITNTFALKEGLELNTEKLKKLVLDVPALLKKDDCQLLKTYNFIHNTMKIPQKLLLQQPYALLTRSFILKRRHQFLQSLGRAQYNPLLPGYVSLEKFVKLSDEKFCENIARTSLNVYNEFLKTL